MIVTGPPRARTEVRYADSGYWAVSGQIHPKTHQCSEFGARNLFDQLFHEVGDIRLWVGNIRLWVLVWG